MVESKTLLISTGFIVTALLICFVVFSGFFSIGVSIFVLAVTIGTWFILIEFFIIRAPEEKSQHNDDLSSVYSTIPTPDSIPEPMKSQKYHFPISSEEVTPETIPTPDSIPEPTKSQKYHFPISIRETPQEPHKEESHTYTRQSIPTAVKREVWRRDGGRCQECGSRERLEYDHEIPVSKGGSNTARNIRILCEKCNRKKHNKIM